MQNIIAKANQRGQGNVTVVQSVQTGMAPQPYGQPQVVVQQPGMYQGQVVVQQPGYQGQVVVQQPGMYQGQPGYQQETVVVSYPGQPVY